MGKRLRKKLRAYDRRQREYALTMVELNKSRLYRNGSAHAPKSGDWSTAFRRPGSGNPRRVCG